MKFGYASVRVETDESARDNDGINLNTPIQFPLSTLLASFLSFIAGIVLLSLVFGSKAYHDSIENLKSARYVSPDVAVKPTFQPLPVKSCLLPMQENESVANCPNSFDLISLLVFSENLNNRDLTIVDVGTNKGYAIAGFLEALYPNSDAFGPLKLLQAISGSSDVSSVLCGACGDCRVTNKPFLMKQQGVIRSVTIYAYDASKRCMDFVQKFFDDASQTVQGLQVFTKTILFSGPEDFGQQRNFTEQSLGDELAHLVQPGEEVNLNFASPLLTTTIDHELASTVDFIDVLLTDTEGWDYHVADGAADLLFGGKVGVYVFELWGKDRPLRSHVEKLAESGYRCFFPLKGDKLRRKFLEISSECWTDRNNVISWANVMCVNTQVFPKFANALGVLSVPLNE